MPKSKKLRAEIVRLHHDMPIGGHGITNSHLLFVMGALIL